MYFLIQKQLLTVIKKKMSLKRPFSTIQDLNKKLFSDFGKLNIFKRKSSNESKDLKH